MKKIYITFLFLILPNLTFAGSAPARKVKIIEATMQNLYDEYETIGECKATSSRDYYAQISGTITSINAKQNTALKAGDVILKINGPLADATYQSADKTLKRNKTLLDKGIISPAALEQSKINFEAARKTYDNMVITAPFDGTIGVIQYEVGDTVTPGDYLVSITSGSKTEFLVNLPEKLINIITHNTKVAIWYDGSYQENGEINSISPYINKESGGFSVKVTTTKKNSKLIHNSFTKIKFFLNPHNALAIPEKAIMKNDTGNFVFLVTKDNIVKQTYVTLGSRLNGNIEVTSGLAEGDKIILEGLTNVSNESIVEIVE